jgi:hypothetical protein
MLSFEAHGTLGGAITAGLWRGRPFVKRKPNSAVRWTAEQRSQRARIGFLKRQWHFLPLMAGVDAHAEWAAVTDNVTSTPYHTWLATNMQRWSDTQSAIAYPGAPDGGLSTAIQALTSSGKGYIRFELRSLDTNPELGALTYLRRGAAPLGTLPYLVWVQSCNNVFGTRYWVRITHLEPGTYQMRSRLFSTSGRNGSLSSTVTGIVVT